MYSKPFVDETLAQALHQLSQAVHAAGLGALVVEDTFHRTARFRHEANGAPPAAAPYVKGVVEGYLSTCYNCTVDLREDPSGALEAALGEGRDVNGGRRR